MNDSPNMRIWSQVDTTDPRHTKQVEFGRKFTSIDAHYQVMRATEVFGPIGLNWGYRCTYGFETARDVQLVWCDLELWWSEDNELNRFGPIRCTVPLFDGKGRFDKDAPKKAMTDGITKALSHLGFNADVFLGRFDDNAYVQEMRARYADAIPEPIRRYENEVEEATTIEELREINEKYREQLGTLKATHAKQVTQAAAKWTAKKGSLAPTPTNEGD